MIVTRQQRVPWSWVWMSQLPFAFWMFAQQLQGTAFTFSLRKFADNPAVLATTISLAQLPVLFIAPVVNYLSDRVWTKWGRRKPFYVLSNALCAVFMALMPLAPNFWTLTALFWLFFVGAGFGKTFFPLSQEVVPVGQRGRASAIHSIMFQLGLLLFYSVLLGRFDDVYFLGPLAAFGSVTGEQFTYWLCALAALLPVLVIALGIKELPIPGSLSLRGEDGRPFRVLGFLRQFFVEVFDKQWAVLYLLLFGGAIYGLGLGSLTGLLYTEQWGYTKQEMGTNVALGALVLLPLTGLIGVVADRYSKMAVYVFALGAALLCNVAYYLFVTFVLADGRPTLWQIIVFGEFTAVFGTFASTVQWPLIYEYIPRTRMGTASAGMEMMQSIFGLVLAPLMGLWVAGYSHFFRPPAGPEVSMTLREPQDAATVRRLLAAAGGAAIYTEPVFAPGEGGTQSRRWKLWLADARAEDLDRRRRVIDEELAHAENDPAGMSAQEDSLRARREQSLALQAELDGRIAALQHLARETFGDQLAPGDPAAVMSARFAPKRYDYFSGYLLSIFGGVAGLGVVLLVNRLERRGAIRKLGVLEEAALTTAHA